MGKKQERKTRKIILHFLLEYDFEVQLEIFFSSRIFCVRLLSEPLTGRLSYDLEISENGIMKCAIPEILNISFCRLHLSVKWNHNKPQSVLPR